MVSLLIAGIVHTSSEEFRAMMSSQQPHFRTSFAARLALLTTMAALVITGCGRNSDPDAAVTKPIRLSYSIFFPQTHIQYQTAAAWAAEVEKRSNGRLIIDMFAAGTLTSAPKIYEGVVHNQSDIGMSCFAYTRGRFPLLEGLDLPVGYPNGMVATTVANAMVAKYKPQELDDTHLLYLHGHGPGILASKTAVTALGQLNRMKVRATGLSAQTVEALGAAPVAMSQPETYEALQRGVVDATLCPLETLLGWRQGEVVSSITDLSTIGYTTTMFVVMNKARWNSLPPDLQQIITDVSQQWIAEHGKAWDEADANARDYVDKLGLPVHSLSAADQQRCRDLVQPVLRAYVENAAAAAANLPTEAFLRDLQEMLNATVAAQ